MALVTRYFPNRAHSSILTALPDIARFLINNHATLTGPGWSVVEAFTSASAAREVPSNSASLSSLTTATSWVSGPIGEGDWIVLESTDGNNTNHFQLYLEADATTRLHMLLIPLCDFVTGGSAVTPPTFPTTSIGSGTSVPITIPVVATPMKVSVIADQGMLTLIHDTGINSETVWTYIGELNGARDNGSPADERCYVIHDSPFDLEWDEGINNTLLRFWNRLSPVDNSTMLSGTTNGGASVFMGSPASPHVPMHSEAERDMTLGVDSILPVGINFGTGIHRHFAGFLRNVYSVHRGLGTAGQLNDRAFIYRNVGNQLHASICFKWDSTTLYP